MYRSAIPMFALLIAWNVVFVAGWIAWHELRPVAEAQEKFKDIEDNQERRPLEWKYKEEAWAKSRPTYPFALTLAASNCLGAVLAIMVTVVLVDEEKKRLAPLFEQSPLPTGSDAAGESPFRI